MPLPVFRRVPSPGCAGLVFAIALAAGAAQAAKPAWVEDEGHPSRSSDPADKAHKAEKGDKGDKGDRARTAPKGGPGAPAQQGSPHRAHDGDGDRRATGGAPAVSVQIQIGGYFNEAQRHATRAYYEPRWKAGKCPPGLAKKGQGCLPPGQARHWQRGQPLPREVVIYPVPDSVRVQLGTPPAGHRFVRVAADILLIAVGTGMVVDAIEDLGRL